VQALPSRQGEIRLCGVQTSTRGSAEFEARQARAGEFAREIKQEPCTIQSYFGFDK
jgi:hypothetical protein|tara:strand:- start:1754 stop:1921 length:168 start_codon:yes stop_codon:yes gene_type:complete